MKQLPLKRVLSVLLVLVMMASVIAPTLGTTAYAANNNYEIKIGETVAMPKAEGNATWTTSDSNVAAVSNDGVVTGVGEGTATITVTIKEEAAPGGSYGWFGYWFHWFFSWTKTTQRSYTVTVVKPVQPEDNRFEIKVGETLALPKTANNAQWTSSDNQIATVSNDGVVTGVKAGTATVTETVRDAGNWFSNFFWFFPWWNVKTTTNEFTITVVDADEPQQPDDPDQPDEPDDSQPLPRPENPTDAEAYYWDNGEVYEVIDAKTSEDVLTETEAIALLTERGFGDCEIVYEYDMEGEYSLKESAEDGVNVKHPMYMAYYLSAAGEAWSVFIVNGEVFAKPVSFNMESTYSAQLLFSESETLTSYDDTDNKFFVTVPKDSAVIVKQVAKIDAETLDKLTIEEISKL